jgi:hypothetical protein
MSPLERSGSNPWFQRGVESQIRDQKDFERFGDELWRGPALEIAQPTVVHKTAKASFILESRHLPFDGDVSASVLSELLVHIRSRYALVGLDVPVQHASKLYREQRIPKNGESVVIELPIINHCARPVELPKGAKPLHFFFVPETAYIKGEELESIVGNESGKAICIQGAVEKDWRMDYETSPTGERLATGLYLKIDPEERFWIPASKEFIHLPEEETTTFQDIREFLANVLKRIDDPEFPMHKNGMWIGKCPHLKLGPNIYVKLDNETYTQDNGVFHKVGLQTHSPLLEGGRTEHHPLVEIRGPANWARATAIRNGQTAKSG